MKILLLRTGRLGDMVMILPAIKELMKQYPEAELHAITSEDGVRLLSVFGLEKKNILLYRNAIFYRIFDTSKLKRYIQQENFDHIFCFELKKRTVSWLPAHSHCIPYQTLLEHYAHRCLRLVNPNPQELHQENYLLTPFLTTSRSHDVLAELLKDQQITSKTILIGLHPTYSGFARWGARKEKIHRLWPSDNFAKLSIQLAEYACKNNLDLKIVMDLLPNEQKIGKKIQQKSQNNIILLPTKPNFQRYLSFLQRLNLLITPNTGVMHLAAALNTPLLALFSKYHPNDCGPYMPKERFIVLRAEDTATPQLGLASISIEQVFDTTIQLLKKMTVIPQMILAN